MCVELYRWSIELEGIFVLPLAPRWVRHSYLSKTVAIPYTCGLSRLFSGAVAGENLKDARTKIFPSTTRGGKELPSCSALDSPSVLSKLVTPTAAIDSDRSHVIDDTACAMRDIYDETTSKIGRAHV